VGQLGLLDLQLSAQAPLLAGAELLSALLSLAKNVPECGALLRYLVGLLGPEPVRRQRGADRTDGLALLRAEPIVFVAYFADNVWNTTERHLQTLTRKSQVVGFG
jgi:hypothetical protein